MNKLVKAIIAIVIIVAALGAYSFMQSPSTPAIITTGNVTVDNSSVSDQGSSSSSGSNQGTSSSSSKSSSSNAQSSGSSSSSNSGSDSSSDSGSNSVNPNVVPKYAYVECPNCLFGVESRTVETPYGKMTVYGVCTRCDGSGKIRIREL